MFGIIMAVVSTGNAIIDGLRRGYENVQAYNRGLERKSNGDITNTYFDWKGTRRDLSTNEIRHVDLKIVESDGQDRCIRDMYGNVVRNLSQENRDAKYLAAKRKGGRTVVLYREYGNGIYNGRSHREFGGDGYCEGPQFKDLNNGEIYVAREFKVKDLKKGDTVDAGYVKFYMDFNGHLVREADSVTNKRRKGMNVPSKDEVTAFINKFNDMQINGNGWHNRKDRIYFKDEFGNKILDKYELQKFYCNKEMVRDDC